jgi:hypothetical protein
MNSNFLHKIPEFDPKVGGRGLGSPDSLVEAGGPNRLRGIRESISFPAENIYRMIL